MMDAASQWLYEYVAWQWPIRGIVTLAFFAFTFKLTAAILRHALLFLIGAKRWIITAGDDLTSDPRYRWAEEL